MNNNNITVGITGVAGFVGSNLGKYLINEGYKVVGIDDLSYGTLRNIKEIERSERFTFIEADVKNWNALNSLKADFWVHLASQKIPRYDNSFKTLNDNEAMSNNMIKKCLNDKVKLVFASTSDVYGKNKDIPFSEESNLVLGSTLVKRWAYAASKMYTEHKIIANNQENELEYTIMRFFGSYGPNQNTTWWGGPQSVFIQNIIEGKDIEIHGDGQQTRTFTYIEDTVSGIVKCIFHSNSKNDIFNIANNPEEEVKIAELASIILELMKKHNKGTNLKLIPYSTFGNYEDVMRRVPDIGKIKNKLGFNPIWSLREGLAKTIDWQTSLLNR